MVFDPSGGLLYAGSQDVLRLHSVEPPRHLAMGWAKMADMAAANT